MSRIGVVVNPAAGSGRADGVWQQLRDEFEQIETAPVVRAASAQEAEHQIAALLDAGIERLLVVGGDGSVHLAVNVLLRHTRRDDVSLGVVPGGTGSDLARALGLPVDPVEGMRVALTAPARTLDAIEMRNEDGVQKFVVNVASAGLSGLVDERVNAMTKRGQLAYLQATLEAIWQYDAQPCRIHLDDHEWFDGRFFLLAVGNGTTFGRGMKIAPEAHVDDGMLDIVLVEHAPLPVLVTQLPLVYLGAHLNSRYVRWQRARRVRFEPQGAMPPFDLDGETHASGPIEWTIRQGALKMHYTAPRA